MAGKVRRIRYERDGEKHYTDEMVEAIRDTLDCNLVFHGNVVSVNQIKPVTVK